MDGEDPLKLILVLSNSLALTSVTFDKNLKRYRAVRHKANETALCTRHFDDYSMQNKKVAKQINKFLLKNLHQKKKFSAYGFFDIDNSVIYTVFSSIITYLVILIQFKQLENDLTHSDRNGTSTGSV
ncbi:gustatory and pheromone receptor 39a [Toxorhynchites rutilus septentrionalis]|uniref:gustatory and pheromone receptor 39a n=1 Tax=Toxorhynchites rutilus septentrionalis TaxID=329112 RepID=UPI00247A0B88|nr:gustatory and pheromone receptor 39a [Toxorhynchites rutilus septentrionalis]